MLNLPFLGPFNNRGVVFGAKPSEYCQDWQPDCSPEVLIQKAYSPDLLGSIGRLELDQRRKRAADAPLGSLKNR